MSAKRDYVSHRVKVSVAKFCQQGLFLSDTNGSLGGRKVRYWFRKHHLSEFNVANHKYVRRHWVGHLREGREARDTDCGVGVVTVRLGTGEHLESEFVFLGSRSVKKVGDWQSAGWGLVRCPCDGWVGFLEVGEYGEEDLPLCLLEVRVGGGGRHSKEQGVPRNLGGVACS